MALETRLKIGLGPGLDGVHGSMIPAMSMFFAVSNAAFRDRAVTVLMPLVSCVIACNASQESNWLLYSLFGARSLFLAAFMSAKNSFKPGKAFTFSLAGYG